MVFFPYKPSIVGGPPFMETPMSNLDIRDWNGCCAGRWLAASQLLAELPRAQVRLGILGLELSIGIPPCNCENWLVIIGHRFSMGFPWFSHVFRMDFPWFSHVFPSSQAGVVSGLRPGSCCERICGLVGCHATADGICSTRLRICFVPCL